MSDRLPRRRERLRRLRGTVGPDAEPTLVVGASPEGTDAHDAFDPVVARVVPGTTASWRWTGYGGPHNVAFEDRDSRFDSFDLGPGVHFEDTGVYRYACEPHESLGQRGAIVVEERQDG